MIRLANKNAWRELLACLTLITVFWFIMHIEGYMYLEGMHDYQGALIHFLALIIALAVAEQFGYISYPGIALIVLMGITGYITTDSYLFSIRTGRDYEFAPWYAYLFPSFFACLVMWWIRRVKLYFAEKRASID